ncbi:shikimate dehydrogenase [uncultured Kushneria sp.]|uniref:shikimate dehydrogenase family protein n=1 Tax=uncultured Kushneria sp. TaxID=905033 RepID=UPI002621BAA7|nr:shikimate dehydrogenase [uncultured Kushneria sp.]
MKLGLIGIGITQSRSPDLHHRLGQLTDIDTRYDLFDVSGVSDFSLPDHLERLQREGYRGVNITYPFKEQALTLARHAGESARRVGSTNTLLFEADGIRAENTDFTGFQSAWRFNFGEVAPGGVVQLGAGGVGRAVAHALAGLQAPWMAIFDTDTERAERLAAELRHLGTEATAIDRDGLADRLMSAEGVLNCSPIGHLDHPGCPLDTTLLRSEQWIFDAVYVPAETELLMAARQRGMTVLSGVDLFVFQGVDAFRWFAASSEAEARIVQQTPTLRAHYHRELIGTTP